MSSTEREFSPDLTVTPDRPLYDESVRITANGLEPGEEATVRARMPLPDGVWESSAVFEVRADGTLDLAEQEPVRGDYEGADPMGLFWSMSHVETEQRATREDDVDATVVSVTVEMYGGTVAQTNVERTISTDDVERTRLDHGELVGEFYRPGDDGPYPTVVLVGGSEGGLAPWMPARLLATRGYAVLTLAYFGVEDLPDALDSIPLEYFETAMDWVADNDLTREESVGVMGWSRGGELALLLGSRLPEITTVVAYAPSSVVYQGIPEGFESAGSAWTSGGEPLDYVPYDFSMRFILSLFGRWIRGKPLGLRPTYESGYESASEETIADAAIPVEETGGPVLLVTGDDDQMWNAAAHADRVVERLDARGYDHEYDHLTYEGAGHGIGVPYHPTTEKDVSDTFLPRLPLDLGGTPEATAAADADSWERVLDVLNRGLRRDD
ncbi:acyl-CoA thioesterase/bile acid-CoA:amino acid N-acyltransferase family protein [Halorussus caseinilyticus]|uniref:Acyl-CoA thioester hydrolase/BAAT C-terminal domain-containing protein n=1 Tax=Halorussus caseinilyticus TaxID=3034025 RepID=A0ABD5WKY7_9EURY|nr:acyl-CoA thioesterase/bile acid-CoA:amino acid N-acyltransferase family protein [Halorussus sp. DT72]